MKKNTGAKGCHSTAATKTSGNRKDDDRFPAAAAPGGTGIKRVALVGSPNVGKSVLFAAIAGTYVTVSNYPGTTVEISRARRRLGSQDMEFVDTPGMYSLLPVTDEERVTRDLLLEQRPEIVVHVVDAKNLARMLPVTFQLIEAGLPVVLDINMIDEADRLGIEIDIDALGKSLGIPIVVTAATTGQGIQDLRRAIAQGTGRFPSPIRYDAATESEIENIAGLMNTDCPVSRRTVAVNALCGDATAIEIIRSSSARNSLQADALIRQLEAESHDAKKRRRGFWIVWYFNAAFASTASPAS